MERTLVLASTSPYRQELLKRLGLPFETASPDIDESRKEEEEPEELVMRLSLEKAKAVATDYPDALIIGSDQVAELGGAVLGHWEVLRPIVEADRLINVPVVKHHSLGRGTLGMKNWFGAVVGPAAAGYLIVAGLDMSANFIVFAVPMAIGGLFAYRLHIR